MISIYWKYENTITGINRVSVLQLTSSLFLPISRHGNLRKIYDPTGGVIMWQKFSLEMWEILHYTNFRGIPKAVYLQKISILGLSFLLPPHSLFLKFSRHQRNKSNEKLYIVKKYFIARRSNVIITPNYSACALTTNGMHRMVKDASDGQRCICKSTI